MIDELKGRRKAKRNAAYHESRDERLTQWNCQSCGHDKFEIYYRNDARTIDEGLITTLDCAQCGENQDPSKMSGQ